MNQMRANVQTTPRHVKSALAGIAKPLKITATAQISNPFTPKSAPMRNRG
jgi:hypothetical protein